MTGAVARGLLVLALTGATGCATAHPGDRWFAEDKAKHFAAAGLAGAGATLGAGAAGADRDSAPVIGVVFAVSLGAGKEAYDRNIKRTYWSWKDLTWDVLGALAGSFLAAQAAE